MSRLPTRAGACGSRAWSPGLDLSTARRGLVAWALDGAPLTPDHGAPLRFVPPPDRWAYKGVKVAAGASEPAERLQARRLSGAVIGLVSAVGALGGLLINVAFRQSFLSSGSGTTAVASFLAFYAACFVVTYAVYLRPGAILARRSAPAAAPVSTTTS